MNNEENTYIQLDVVHVQLGPLPQAREFCHHSE